MPPVEAVLKRFRHDHLLEERPAQRMRRHLPRALDAEQVAGQPHVVEVELRRLDQAPADVRVERRQLEDDVARLEDCEPLPRGRVGHARVRAERAQVEQLADASRAETHEESERREVDRSGFGFDTPASPVHAFVLAFFVARNAASLSGGPAPRYSAG